MFGYMEGPYDVLRSHVLTTETQRQMMEIRANSSERYIAIEGYDESGKLVLDYLLLYMKGADAAIEDDWRRITTEPHVKISELHGWSEAISNHATGRGRDGHVTMY